MKLHIPWPSGYTINTRSPYGWRVHPITGKRKFHQGVDVAGSFPVTAACAGKVSKVGWSPRGGGHTVLIDHGEIVTVYYHGAHKTALKVGNRVKAGDFVYTSGTTGASTGNHLHFEVRKRGGRWGNTMDPVPFLQGSPSVVASPLRVTGRLDRDTWLAWQRALNAAGHNSGIVDGRPGRMTYSAVQEWAGAPIDGQLGPQTRKAVQERLGVKPDGVWGRITVSALQRALNDGSV